MVKVAGPLPRIWCTDFTVQSRNEAYKNSAEIIQKFMVRRKGDGRTITPPPSPEYATEVVVPERTGRSPGQGPRQVVVLGL